MSKLVLGIDVGTRSDLWPQIVSDVLGQPQQMHRLADLELGTVTPNA